MIKEVVDCFEYNPSNGVLTWKVRPRHHFRTERGWKIANTRWAGKPVGTLVHYKKSGSYRLMARNFGITRSVSAWIWILVNGQIPDGMEVDHIDGDPNNNRISNLRLGSRHENMRNTKTKITNKLGLKGVIQSPAKHKVSYYAHIHANGRQNFLGSFPTKGLAALAYAKASIKHQGRFSVFCRNL